jgi:vacuolar-type H+-ATPase subunit E/Vma4
MATKKRDSRHDDDAAPSSAMPASSAGKRGSDVVPRSSSPPPSLVARWGRVRDSLAAMGNVETVLRSADALPLPADVEAELRRALSWLREAFEAAESEALAADQRAARGVLRTFADRRLAAVEQMLATLDVASQQQARDTLASANADLDAAAGLLELAERAAVAASIELSIASLAEQSLQVAWSIRARPVDVHVHPSAGDCSVSCDPHVVARLLAIGVALVHHTSGQVVVRTHVEGQTGTIEVAAYGPEDGASRLMQTRLVSSIEPTEIIIRAAAAAAGVGIQVEPGRVLLICPRVA